MIPVVPALIPSDEYDVIKAAGDVAWSREFHLDVVDGKFVENCSWPFTPAGEPAAVGHTLRGFSLEVDLMVAQPSKPARLWQEAGADRLVFHVETLTPEELENIAADATASVGVACHGATPIELLLEYATKADFIQLMGIREIGTQGQPFDERVLDSITKVKQELPSISVTVDGSVNKDTIARLAAAGADRFIVGSAIMKREDKEQAWHELSGLINQTLL
ncbi:hypothetical protein KC887_03580 [Candidatus Kaiserbacteria bacterium]|nr:hypothetical protein [Candidatus Kaiserbacteria bacterium]